MLGYLSKKLITLILLLFLVSIAVFAVLFVLPGDPAQIILGIKTPRRSPWPACAPIWGWTSPS